MSEAAPEALPRPKRIHGIFEPPEKQIDNVRRGNAHFEWGFTERDFDRLPSPPEWPEDPLTAVVLVPYLDTVARTFGELVAVAARALHADILASWRGAGEILLAPKADDVCHQLRWEVIDLGANQWKSPVNVDHPLGPPHAGVLAVAAHHPRWLLALDRIDTNSAWIAGYRIRVPGTTAPRYLRLSCTGTGTGSVALRRPSINLIDLIDPFGTSTATIPMLVRVSSAGS